MTLVDTVLQAVIMHSTLLDLNCYGSIISTYSTKECSILHGPLHIQRTVMFHFNIKQSLFSAHCFYALLKLLGNQVELQY